MKRLLVTGGAGFIGSNYVRYALERHDDVEIVVFDKLTYAGNLDNLTSVADDPRYTFVRGDIADRQAVAAALAEHNIDMVVNFAAESHVDRSILNPDAFIQTDVVGVYTLLDESRKHGIERFLQVSTDEVYGSIDEGEFVEGDAFEPNSPYSASKAGGELMVRAYHVTYGMNTGVTRGSNTFGPYQYPEKLLPLFITNAIDDQPLPMYGDGMQVRDWLYVMDHASAIDLVLWQGEPGEAYNVGGKHEMHNIDIIKQMLAILGKPESLITFVEDRPGHDRRYAIANEKIEALGWEHSYQFDAALAHTVEWYQQNEDWWRTIKSGEYMEYYKSQYGDRIK
jgi:dTDP-glucose 4,6-dehydratase